MPRISLDNLPSAVNWMFLQPLGNRINRMMPGRAPTQLVAPTVPDRFERLEESSTHQGNKDILAPLRTEQLPQAVRKKIEDVRTLLQTPSNELEDVFINHRRGGTEDSELCFTFSDPDKFPKALKEEYGLGTVSFYLPARLIPEQALENKESLSTWLNLPSLSSKTQLRYGGNC